MGGGWGIHNLSLGRPDTKRWHTTLILLEDYLVTVQNKHNKEVRIKKLIGASLHLWKFHMAVKYMDNCEKLYFHIWATAYVHAMKILT